MIVTVVIPMFYKQRQIKYGFNASKRLYFLVRLKRSKVPRQDMSTFHTAYICSFLTYAAPAFFFNPVIINISKEKRNQIWPFIFTEIKCSIFFGICVQFDSTFQIIDFVHVSLINS